MLRTNKQTNKQTDRLTDKETEGLEHRPRLPTPTLSVGVGSTRPQFYRHVLQVAETGSVDDTERASTSTDAAVTCEMCLLVPRSSEVLLVGSLVDTHPSVWHVPMCSVGAIENGYQYADHQ